MIQEAPTESKFPPRSPRSYFSSITTSQQNIRFKVPKLLIKTDQRSHSQGGDEEEDDNGGSMREKLDKAKKLLLPKRVGTILSGFFGKKRSAKVYRSGDGENLPSVISRNLSSWRKLKVGNLGDKKLSRWFRGESEEEEDEGGEELCKKRILMGEKCRPLNFSGILKYDQNGILLPELLP